jgi:hypothetical protein
MLKGGIKLAPKPVEEELNFDEALEKLGIEESKIKSKNLTKSKITSSKPGLIKGLGIKPIGFKKTEVSPDKIIDGKVGPIDSSKTFIFEENDWLTFGDGDGTHEYHERKYEIKKSTHYGQLKLLTTELQFFNKYWNPIKVPEPTCVYIGAAPGTHIAVLSRLYPSFQFHLYDAGNVFDDILRTEEFSSKIKLFTQYFKDEDAKKYSGRNDIFFISDIRSLTYHTARIENEDTRKKDEETVLNDMKLQMNWYNIIKPFKAHLKFRLPFGYQYDWVLKELDYLDGDVYRQPWAPQTSTETRLVPDDGLPNRKWNCKVYEDTLFYHNKIVREKAVFINPVNNLNSPVYPEYGLTQDYDSIVFISTLLEYIDRFSYVKTIDREKTVLRLTKSILEDLGKPFYIKDLRNGIAAAEAEED